MMKKGIIFLIICLIVSLFLTATGCESSINDEEGIRENIGSQNKQLLDFYPLHDGLEYGVMVGKAKYLSQIVIPEIYLGLPVTTILSKGFSDCNDLRSIIIPGSVTSIGYEAFYGCSSLTSITIPNSVTSIGWYAFRDCSSLTIYAQATSKPSGWDSDWNYSNCPVVWNYQG